MDLEGSSSSSTGRSPSASALQNGPRDGRDIADRGGLVFSLEEVRQVTSNGGVFIALHGVNKFPADLIRRLIVAGVMKVNLNRDILATYYDHFEKYINEVPFPQLLEDGVEVIARSMGDYMDIVLSSGKAQSPYYSAGF